MNFLEDKRFVELDKRFYGPLVYVIFSENEVLYIGSSKNGLSRPLGHNHKHIKLLMNNIAKLAIMYCQSEGESRAIEQELITLYKPKLNERVREYKRRKTYEEIINQYKSKKRSIKNVISRCKLCGKPDKTIRNIFCKNCINILLKLKKDGKQDLIEKALRIE